MELSHDIIKFKMFSEMPSHLSLNYLSYPKACNLLILSLQPPWGEEKKKKKKLLSLKKDPVVAAKIIIIIIIVIIECLIVRNITIC